MKNPVDPKMLDILINYKKRREKLVMVLNGGGAFGAHEFGKIYRLGQLGILPCVDLFVGTSVGGLNALLMSPCVPLARIARSG